VTMCYGSDLLVGGGGWGGGSGWGDVCASKSWSSVVIAAEGIPTMGHDPHVSTAEASVTGIQPDRKLVGQWAWAMYVAAGDTHCCCVPSYLSYPILSSQLLWFHTSTLHGACTGTS
jgi:hypothetical protein